MTSRYPRFRHAQANPGPFGRHRPPPARRSGFGVLVAVAALGMFAGTWFATPALQRLWSDATLIPRTAAAPPEDVAAIERSVTYSGCREARAAGAAPIARGSPGYRASMDGDGDGIACENYSGSGYANEGRAPRIHRFGRRRRH